MWNDLSQPLRKREGISRVEAKPGDLPYMLNLDDGKVQVLFVKEESGLFLCRKA